MTTHLNPYLGFQGNARAAMEFYQSVLGGELSVMKFADVFGEESGDDKDLVMHAMLTSPSGLVLMGADTPSSMPFNPGDTVSVSISGEDEQELTGYWEKLSIDATVTAPLNKAPWGDTFGMCTDKFGTKWLVNITGSPS